MKYLTKLYSQHPQYNERNKSKICMTTYIERLLSKRDVRYPKRKDPMHSLLEKGSI